MGHRLCRVFVFILVMLTSGLIPASAREKRWYLPLGTSGERIGVFVFKTQAECERKRQQLAAFSKFVVKSKLTPSITSWSPNCRTHLPPGYHLSR
jgi:hypothetical protein